MGISNDLGAATFGTGGCYVFGVFPANYPVQNPHADLDAGKDVIEIMLETAIREQPDIFATVPWVVEGLKEKYTHLLDLGLVKEASKLRDTFTRIRPLGCGGAMLGAATATWALDIGINILSDLGMTELGGELLPF